MFLSFKYISNDHLFYRRDTKEDSRDVIVVTINLLYKPYIDMVLSHEFIFVKDG